MYFSCISLYFVLVLIYPLIKALSIPSLKNEIQIKMIVCLFFCPVSSHRCSGWIQWHYLRIWTNRLREDSHHGGTVFRAIKQLDVCVDLRFFPHLLLRLTRDW